MDNKKYKYYSVKELNDPINKERLKGTRKYYYKRLKEVKEKKKYVKCPDWNYKNLGVQPRHKKITNTGNRCSIAVKWNDTDESRYNNRNSLIKNNNIKRIFEEPVFIKKKKKTNKKKEVIKEITYNKPKNPILISFT